jgi:hypothetical protein
MATLASQNGYDCGPDAFTLMERILTGSPLPDAPGFEADADECRHLVRARILEELALFVATGSDGYSRNRDIDTGAVDLHSGPILQLFAEGVKHTQPYRQTNRALELDKDRCSRCKDSIRPSAAGQKPIVAEDLLDGALQRIMNRSHNTLVPRDEAAAPEPVGTRPGSSERDMIEPADDPDNLQDLLRSSRRAYVGTAAASREQIDRRTIPQRRPLRGISAIELERPAWDHDVLRFDETFDDYHDGTTLEQVNDICPIIQGPGDEAPKLGLWQRFGDWGWRMLPSSIYQFDCQRSSPDVVLEHCLAYPVSDGTTAGTRSSSSRVLGAADAFQRLHIELGEPPQRSLPRAWLFSSTSGTLQYGLADFLNRDLTGSPGSLESIKAFVCGIHTGEGESRDGDSYITVDPAEDARKLNLSSLTISVDIDSIIILLHEIRTKKSVGIHILPYYGKKPPIAKKNHVYIRLLLPPREADIVGGKRTDWFERRISLSSIPHTHFATSGSSRSTVNIYVFFPRMLHKAEFQGYWEVRMPNEVQELWLSQIVFPAIREIHGKMPEYRSYCNLDMDHVKSKYKGKRRALYDIKPQHLVLVQSLMRDMIKEPEFDEMSAYRSFFFVIEVKGCKSVVTSDHMKDEPDAWEMLEEEFSVIDWDWVMDRHNAETLVDIGVNFHPPTPLDPDEGEAAPYDVDSAGRPWSEPLVGLWNRERLQASYDRAGYNKGQSHSAGTFANYGAEQAPMSLRRANALHMLYRQSYNLSYEVIRGDKTRERKMLDAKDAYELNGTFIHSCNQLASTYFGAKKRVFGVRDEIRVGGSLAKELMPQLRAKVGLSRR